MTVDAADEGRHEPGPEQLWGESWYFDFVAEGGALGGYVRLGFYPALGTAWYWAYLVGDGRPLVAVRDHDVPIPKGRPLEVRAEGLWSELVCETPHEHWSVNLEAFAVAMNDPADAYRDERGERIALGLDLEWVAAGPSHPYTGMTRYEQACSVAGEVLVGDERISVDGWGERDHSWGVRDWWAFPWCWTAGRLDDGTAFHASRPLLDVPYSAGFVLPAGGGLRPVEGFAVDTELGDEGLPERASMAIDELELSVVTTAHAPVLLTAGDGRVSRFPRSMCRFDAGDDRTGWGWTEWLQPPG